MLTFKNLTHQLPSLNNLLPTTTPTTSSLYLSLQHLSTFNYPILRY